MPDGENLDIQSAPTPEELKQEEQALAETKEDEVKAKVIEELGLDETVDAELIAKLTSERLQHKKELSIAIRQKIKAREALKSVTAKPVAISAAPASLAEPVDVETKVNEILNERDLRSLDLSDELKAEIKAQAKARGISYLEASKLPYIAFQKAEEARKIKIEKASLGGKQKAPTATTEFSENTRPSDFDMKTPEGREGFRNFKAWKGEQLKQ